jgi:hypothetical protein
MSITAIVNCPVPKSSPVATVEHAALNADDKKVNGSGRLAAPPEAGVANDEP